MRPPYQDSPFVRYSTIPSLTFAANSGAGCTNGTYSSQLVTGGSGTKATWSATIAGNVLTAASISNIGTGYTSAPTASFTGMGCTTSPTVVIAAPVTVDTDFAIQETMMFGNRGVTTPSVYYGTSPTTGVLYEPGPEAQPAGLSTPVAVTG